MPKRTSGQVRSVKGRIVAPQYPETARVFLGAKKSGGRPGREIKGFRIQFNDKRGFNIPYMEAVFNEIYGVEPVELNNVYFMGYEPDDVLTSHMEKWAVSQSGNPMCLLRCNGEEILSEKTQTGMNWNPQPCRFEQKCGCQLNARLTFWLRDFQDALPGIVGYFMITMHSQTSFENVLGGLTGAYSLGGIAMKPFRLYRQEQLMNDPDGKPIKHYIVHLDSMPVFDAAIAISAPAPVPALSSTVTIDSGWTALQLRLKVFQHKETVWYRFFDYNGDIYQTNNGDMLVNGFTSQSYAKLSDFKPWDQDYILLNTPEAQSILVKDNIHTITALRARADGV